MTRSYATWAGKASGTLARFLRKAMGNRRSGSPTNPAEDRGSPQPAASRRQMLGRLGALPIVGAASWTRSTQANDRVDAVTQPTRIVIKSSDSDEYWRLKKLDLDGPESRARQKRMPAGKIGDLTMGRLICGSNLISMNMHARDLDYVSDLARAYNTEERIFMTLKKCEDYGGNGIVLKDHNFRHFGLQKYWSEWGGEMVWLADVITTDIKQYERRLEQHLELGADSAYLWGGASDIWYHKGQQDNIIKAYEIMRSYDIPVGIGAHRLEPIEFCVREGLRPDYYFKTLHHDRYWSAHPQKNRRFMEMYEAESPDHDEYHDNMFCHDHQETIDFMQDVDVPWIAFKVLAAGAIPPKNGIQYAFDNGADYICLGMFDFQVEEDARLIRECVAKAADRKRPWY